MTYEPRLEKTFLQGFRTSSDTNRAKITSTEEEVEGMYYLCSKNGSSHDVVHKNSSKESLSTI